MANEIVTLLGKALVLVAVFCAFALFRKYLPAQALPQGKEKTSIEDLDVQFKSAKWLLTIAMIMIGILLAWGLHFALVWINLLLARSQGPARFYFFPEPAIWWFLPGFAGLALSWEITLQLWSLLGDRSQVELYCGWLNTTGSMWGGKGRYAGLDYRRTLRWLGVFVVLPIGVLSILAVPIHSALTEEGIRECGYAFKGCRVEQYSEARRLIAVHGLLNSKGRFIARAGIIVDFNDGHRWSSANSGSYRRTVDPDLEQFLVAKTKLPVANAETPEDVLPLQ